MSILAIKNHLEVLFAVLERIWYLKPRWQRLSHLSESEPIIEEQRWYTFAIFMKTDISQKYIYLNQALTLHQIFYQVAL